jgi:hypothetical protein
MNGLIQLLSFLELYERVAKNYAGADPRHARSGLSPAGESLHTRGKLESKNYLMYVVAASLFLSSFF